MGFEDALRDGVRYTSDGVLTNYYPKCHMCGTEFMSWKYAPEQTYTCQNCKYLLAMHEKEKRISKDREPKEKKLENAIQRISHTTSIGKYKRAIKAVEAKLHDDKAFESTEEIMTALELERCNISYRHQVQFGRYRADFVIPNMKVVLEIDGTIYHGQEKRTKENLRDNLIVLALGAEWEVIRITDDLINTNITRLVQAVQTIKKKRQLIRRQYKGDLPEWYSDRKQ